MANVNFPRGFIPVKGNFKTEYYDVAAANGAIDKGDLVERRTDGYIHRGQATSITIVGVAAESKAASAGGTIAVYDDPFMVYQAQCDDSTVDAQTDLDLNYDIAVGSVGTGTNGQSVMQIDASTQAATATLPIKILRVVNKTPSDNALGANVLVECIINNHLLKSTGVIG